MKQQVLDVQWQRVARSDVDLTDPTFGVQECRGLTPRQAAARLATAIRSSGPILVHAVTIRRAES